MAEGNGRHLSEAVLRAIAIFLSVYCIGIPLSSFVENSKGFGLSPGLTAALDGCRYAGCVAVVFALVLYIRCKHTGDEQDIWISICCAVCGVVGILVQLVTGIS